jgi:hypothetical protein
MKSGSRSRLLFPIFSEICSPRIGRIITDEEVPALDPPGIRTHGKFDPTLYFESRAQSIKISHLRAKRDVFPSPGLDRRGGYCLTAQLLFPFGGAGARFQGVARGRPERVGRVGDAAALV